MSEFKVKVTELAETNEFTIGAWLVESKNFHQEWNQWVVSCVILRGLADGQPAKLQDDTKTHEISVLAIDPKNPIKFDTKGAFAYMDPADHVIQVSLDTDAEARELVEKAIDMIEEGTLSPDSDYRSLWESVLGAKTFYVDDRDKPKSGKTAMGLPAYSCKKKVRGLQIKEVKLTSEGGVILSFVRDQFADIEISAKHMTKKPDPQAGWYYVVYRDGYFSFSPQKEFEDGYDEDA